MERGLGIVAVPKAVESYHGSDVKKAFPRHDKPEPAGREFLRNIEEVLLLGMGDKPPPQQDLDDNMA
jgi:hypothetical protein